MEDAELLRKFVEAGSQSALAELTRRYVDLVYSAALRQVRDPAAAEDVTQVVFLVLARKAKSLNPGTVLSAWLFKAARLAALNVLRTESRRRRHERRAARMEATPPPGPEPLSWERISPELDDAIAQLSAKSRTAILLRFFEGKSFAEVGKRLGITELAARQRVFRGLEHLRAEFVARGTILSSAAIGELIAKHAVGSAPAHLATQSAAGAAAAAASAHQIAVAKGVVAVMAWTKTKIAASCAVSLLLLGGAGGVAYHALHSESVRTVTLAPGDAAARMSFPNAPPPLDGESPSGAVFTSEGNPLVGADVIVGQTSARAELFGAAHKGFAATRTDKDGRFKIGVVLSKQEPWAVIVTCDKGYAAASAAQLRADHKIVIIPWARIEGEARFEDRPAAGAQVLAARFGFPGIDVPWSINFDQTVTADSNGHFVFPHVAPGGVWLSLNYPGLSQSHFIGIRIQPGQTKNVTLGGGGRTVVGHVANPGKRQRGTLKQVAAPVPASSTGAPLDQGYDFPIRPDGSFRVQDVPPGAYALDLIQTSPDGLNIAGQAHSKITVPIATAAEPGVEPIDAGTLTLRFSDVDEARR